MSKIGKNPVSIPDGVTVDIQGQNVNVKGSKGALALCVHDEVSVVMEDVDGAKIVRLAAKNEGKLSRQLWPTMRTLVSNMIVGVSEGYTKVLELKGVGYRANLQGQTLVLQLGFSHDVHFPIPEGVKVEVDKQTKITLSGIDKQLIGQTAAKIRAYRPPEPYKGKGVHYEGEYVFRKEGKKK